MFGTAERRNEIRTETACHTISIEACRAPNHDHWTLWLALPPPAPQ